MTRTARSVRLADPVGIYLDEVSGHELLTADDEVRLARDMEAGVEAAERLEFEGDILTVAERRELIRAIRRGEEAKAQFIQANLRLVISIAKRYMGRGLDFLDLIQEGNLCRREVRLAQGIQVLDLCDVVDPPGDHPRARQPGPDDPAAGSHGRRRANRPRNRAGAP